jgi:histidyl-tRNA synthetase
MMLADTLDALGLGGDYIVKINSRKLLDGILEAAGVAEDRARRGIVRQQRRTAFRYRKSNRRKRHRCIRRFRIA